MVTLKNPFETFDSARTAIPRPAVENSRYQDRLDRAS